MTDKPIKKNIEYHFNQDNHGTGWLSDNGEGFNRGDAGDFVSDLINELYEKEKLKKCTDYIIKVNIEIQDNKKNVAKY